MTKLYQLADRAQLALGDAAEATWPQDTIEGWLQEAIRDYSQHFKRTCTASLTITAGCAGDHRFPLPEDFCGMIQAEYPAGEDPPVYLQRLSRKSPRFWGSAGYYDVESAGDADWDDVEDQPANPATFWISDEVEAGETIGFAYTANHDAGVSSLDYVTVPAEHEHLLIKFVTWQAMNEREAVEAQNPDTTIRMLQQFKLASQAAEAAYRSALADAKKALSGGGQTGPWRADCYDPVY
jgi:hypothetical protein